MARYAVALACCLVSMAAAACGGTTESRAPAAAAMIAPSAPTSDLAGPARFAVRGRRADPSRITVRLETGSPIGDAAFGHAVERAMAIWNETGRVGFVLAADDDDAVANVTLGWRRGHHGACEPFGTSADVAHTGPMAPATFVHFDLGRRWSEQGLDGVSVFHTALHELGHVLGLGHTEAPGAVMSNDVERPGALSPDDFAGLHSLYGGGASSDGDLQIVRADGTVAATLYGVGPPSCCAFAAFDCNGDGKDEVVVWRTDAAGYGALTLFFFDAVPQLVRTLGPFYGAVVPGSSVAFVVGPAGERLLSSGLAASPAVRQFSGIGVPGLPEAPPSPQLLSSATSRERADFDGDGATECAVRRPAH